MKQVLLVFGLLSCSALTAQDTIAFRGDLDTISITAPIKQVMIHSGVRTDYCDTTISRLYPSGTLADLLGGGGMINLKSYGPGGLSTMALRGANSMQTPILWNGINLQNINNNTVDLSLIPVFLFDEISVQPGSSSTAWGSGAIGGAINLNTSVREDAAGIPLTGPYFKSKLVAEAGSFGTWTGGYQYACSTGNWNFDLKLFRQQSKNNFPSPPLSIQTIQTDSGVSVSRVQHGRFNQHGFMTEVGYTSGNLKHIVTFRNWVQESFHEIIPTTLQVTNESTQQDYTARFAGEWLYFHSKALRFNTRLAVIHEGLLYDPGYNQPLNNTNAWTYLAETEMIYRFRKQSGLLHRAYISSGMNAVYSESEVTGYIEQSSQIRNSASMSMGRMFRDFDEINFSIREEVINGNFNEPAGSLWYCVYPVHWLRLRACVSHSYRVPTFNDLYWTPGGNRNLLPETSWTEEFTTEVFANWKLGRWAGGLRYAITVYNRDVVNLITWRQVSSYWSPENIAAVNSHGAEHRLKFEQSLHRWKLIQVLNLDYVRSTYMETAIPNDVALGKQLIYVPAWFGGSTTTVQWKTFFMTFAVQYTDVRFTTRDHLEWIPSYWLSTASVGWSFSSVFRKFQYNGHVYLRCSNTADVQYESMKYRPMPGRAVYTGVVFSFSKQKSTQ